MDIPYDENTNTWLFEAFYRRSRNATGVISTMLAPVTYTLTLERRLRNMREISSDSAWTSIMAELPSSSRVAPNLKIGIVFGNELLAIASGLGNAGNQYTGRKVGLR